MSCPIGCVAFGIRAKSFTSVNTCRPHPLCLAFQAFQRIGKGGCVENLNFGTPPLDTS